MKRPFATYIIGVVVPCTLIMLWAGRASRTAWSQLHHTSAAHVGRMALAALEQSLGEQVASMAARAEPFATPDPTVPAVRRAMSGDTVAALNPVSGGAELAVMLGDPAAEPDTAGLRPVLYLAEPFSAAALDRVARATGYHIAGYLNGRKWTDGPGGPDRLADDFLAGLMRAPGGLAVEGTAGVAQAQRVPGGEASASLVVVAEPARAQGPAVELRIKLVLVLLIFFAVLAGWIQLARPPSAGQPRPGPGPLVTMALVPTLTAALFLVHITRSFEEAVAESTVADLTRGLAVAAALGVEEAPTGTRYVTGFHATVLRDGRIEATTYDGDPHGVAGIPAPPTSFTISGTVDTPEGPSFYVALRRRGGRVVVITTPLPGHDIQAFRRQALGFGGTLAGWLTMLGGLLLLVGRRKRS